MFYCYYYLQCDKNFVHNSCLKGVSGTCLNFRSQLSPRTENIMIAYRIKNTLALVMKYTTSLNITRRGSLGFMLLHVVQLFAVWTFGILSKSASPKSGCFGLINNVKHLQVLFVSLLNIYQLQSISPK